jgi:hypothetical protein
VPPRPDLAAQAFSLELFTANDKLLDSEQVLELGRSISEK